MAGLAAEVIDIFCHWLPAAFYRKALRVAARPLHMLTRANGIPAMTQLDARLALMEQFPGYRQVPCLSSPPIEFLAGPEEAPELARIANDSLASLVAEHGEHFPGFVASLPMNNPDAALTEAERAIADLGASGVQVFSNVNGRPLDEPCFLPLFEMMANLDLPVWLHPARGMTFADYRAEEVSKFELWWALGWPYETSVAMARLVFAGVFDRSPRLKIIAHHVGGMIPMMEGRLGPGLDLLGTRTPPEQAEAVKTNLSERPLDALRRFYADTASFGSRPAIECGISFFGDSNVLFGSDMPFDPERGPGYIRETLRAIGEIQLSRQAREDILAGNARRILRLERRGEQDSETLH